MTMTTNEKIDVLVDYKGGKTIEYCLKDSDSEWNKVIGNPVWDFSNFNYRVQRTPRIVYVKLNKNGSIFESTRNASCAIGSGWFSFREIMD